MCTLTFVPRSDGFIVTSNRDESIRRGRALSPRVHLIAGQHVLMPQDPDKAGTWIAVSESGRVAVLLNGAFTRHKHEPPYRRSRGLVLLDAFAFDDLNRFVSAYDFAGIEPFTLITMTAEGITDVRWDGDATHLSTSSGRAPAVWCSAQMYSSRIQAATAERFSAFLARKPEASVLELIDFNREESYDLKMRRAGESPLPFLKTVSISSMQVAGRSATFRYIDLPSSETSIAQLDLR